MRRAILTAANAPLLSAVRAHSGLLCTSRQAKRCTKRLEARSLRCEKKAFSNTCSTSSTYEEVSYKRRAKNSLSVARAQVRRPGTFAPPQRPLTADLRAQNRPTKSSGSLRVVRAATRSQASAACAPLHFLATNSLLILFCKVNDHLVVRARLITIRFLWIRDCPTAHTSLVTPHLLYELLWRL